MYWILISDAGETGLYKDNEMILSWRELRELGYDVYYIVGWTSRQLERILH